MWDIPRPQSHRLSLVLRFPAHDSELSFYYEISPQTWLQWIVKCSQFADASQTQLEFSIKESRAEPHFLVNQVAPFWKRIKEKKKRLLFGLKLRFQDDLPDRLGSWDNTGLRKGCVVGLTDLASFLCCLWCVREDKPRSKIKSGNQVSMSFPNRIQSSSYFQVNKLLHQARLPSC